MHSTHTTGDQPVGLMALINYIITLTVAVRQRLVTMINAGKVRLATRFTFINWSVNKTVVENTPKKNVSMTKFFEQIGYRENETVQFGPFVSKVMAYFGFTYTNDQIAMIGTINGLEYGSQVHMDVVLRILGITDNLTTIRTGRGKTRKRTKGFNMYAIATALYTQLMGEKYDSATQTQTLALEILAYSPSIRSIKALWGKKVVRLVAVFQGTKLVLVDHNTTFVVRKSPVVSMLTTHDIVTSTHAVPMTEAITKLLEQGYIEASELGIDNVELFVNTAFSFGLSSAYKTMVRNLQTMNKDNDKIASNLTGIDSALQIDDVTTQIDKLGDVTATVCDDVETEIDVPAAFAGVGIGNETSPFASSLPGLSTWQGGSTPSIG